MIILRSNIMVFLSYLFILQKNCMNPCMINRDRMKPPEGNEPHRSVIMPHKTNHFMHTWNHSFIKFITYTIYFDYCSIFLIKDDLY